MASSNPHYEADPGAIDYKEKDGKQIITVKPRGLNIVWGRDERYWVVPKDDKPAELLQVCWLEVTGSVDITKPEKDYAVKFGVSLTPDAFGWGSSPIYIMVKRGKDGKPSWKKDSLNNYDGTKEISITKKPDRENQTDVKKLYFGLYEVWSGRWKGGLKIHNVMVESID